MGTVAEYESAFVVLANRVTGISEYLLTSFYISGLKLALQIDLLRARPKTLGEAFALARITEARFEDERATTIIAKPNDLNIVVQVQDIEETTLHTSDNVVGVAGHQNSDEPNVLKGNVVIGVGVNKNNKGEDKEVQYSVYALHVLIPLLKRLHDKYIKKKKMEAVIQRRLWDPGIKSVFQDNTLRAR
ncbi:hypothetical protein Tco_0189059 [Tanacetum coccineum]